MIEKQLDVILCFSSSSSSSSSSFCDIDGSSNVSRSKTDLWACDGLFSFGSYLLSFAFTSSHSFSTSSLSNENPVSHK